MQNLYRRDDLGKIINHWPWMRTNSHSLIRAAKRSVTRVVNPVPGMDQAIQRRDDILYLLELVNRLPTLSFRIVSHLKSLPSTSVEGVVWYRSLKPSGWLSSKNCRGKCWSLMCSRAWSPHRGHHLRTIFDINCCDDPRSWRDPLGPVPFSWTFLKSESSQISSYLRNRHCIYFDPRKETCTLHRLWAQSK